MFVIVVIYKCLTSEICQTLSDCICTWWMYPFKIFTLINLISWWQSSPFWMNIFRYLFSSHRHINWRYLVGRQNQRSAECNSRDESSWALCNVCYFTILKALKKTRYQRCVMYVIHIECFSVGFPLQGNGSKTIYIADRLFKTEMLKEILTGVGPVPQALH